MEQTDAISRSEALKSAELISWYHANQKGKMVPGASSSNEAYVEFNDVVSLLENATALDVAPVVRCRDCKYAFQNNGHDKEGCPIMDRRVWMDGNSFCSEGKRMDGEDDAAD